MQNLLTGSVRVAICLVFGMMSNAVWAQNAGGIFPPMVQEGHQSLQYRITYAPSTNAHVQRLHYQQALGSALMWRAVVQTKGNPDDGFGVQHGQGELFWDFSADGSKWKRGLRLDGRVRTGQNPGLVGLHFTNQFNLNERLSLRFIGLSFMDVGRGVEPDVQLQTRGSAFTRLDSGLVVGLEFYNVYGTTSNFQSLPDQVHTVGPFAFIPVTDEIQLFTGVLAGLTDASPSLDLRLWATYTF